MSRSRQRTAMLIIVGVVASLFTAVTAQVATAVESIPELQWPAPVPAPFHPSIATDPKGNVTVGCGDPGPRPQDQRNVVTYGPTGTIVHQVAPVTIDGMQFCFPGMAVDKNGDMYGQPRSHDPVRAYRGSTLKWTYDTGCPTGMTVGANGNLYFVNASARLIGLTPEVVTGTTQPKKVLDVAAPYGCAEVRTFMEGVAVISPGGTETQFYSYSGANLGQPPGTYWQTSFMEINAVGRLFYDPYVEDYGWSGKVAAYDPLTQRTAWTAQPGTPGAKSDWNGIAIKPIPGGGFAALVDELKMNGSVPAIPQENVKTLVVIGSTGQKMWSTQLPNTDGDGGILNNVELRVDTAGKLVLIRGWAKEIDGTYVPFLTVDLLDAFTGKVIAAPKVLRGNMNPSDGPLTGFRDDYLWFASIGLNTVYLNPARCLSGCTPNSETLYPIKVMGLGLDYPRGAVLNGYTPLPYVALGDSYSSGEGIPPFESPTDTNGCHRSVTAYPRLVSEYTSRVASLASGGFWACSGAKTENIISVSFKGEAAQSTRLNANTKIVTLTIGGNDMGFTDFGTECVLNTCNFSSPIYATTKSKIDNEVPSKLVNTYKLILQKAPNAKIYVLDYPQVAPVKTATDPNDPRCSWLYNSSNNSSIPKPWEDAQAARDIVSRLNTKISDSVNAVRALNPSNVRLRYVPVNASYSPFNGHTVCSAPGDSFFNNLDQWPGHPSYVLHPNERGAHAYAQVAVRAMMQ